MADPRFAAKTTVSAAKTREQISDLLRRWKCDQIGWAETLTGSRTSTVQFAWSHGGRVYAARMRVTLPHDTIIRGTKRMTPLQLEAAREQRWRSLHRLLLLKLTADLNAVADGLFTAIEVFLPYLVTASGRTVAEIATNDVAGLLEARHG